MGSKWRNVTQAFTTWFSVSAFLQLWRLMTRLGLMFPLLLKIEARKSFYDLYNAFTVVTGVLTLALLSVGLFLVTSKGCKKCSANSEQGMLRKSRTLVIVILTIYFTMAFFSIVNMLLKHYRSKPLQ